LRAGVQDAKQLVIAGIWQPAAARPHRVCDGCPPLAELVKRYEAAGGRYYACPICFNAKQLSPEALIAGAELQGTVPMWAWIGDEAATTFSY
jgi:hypothetical protein